MHKSHVVAAVALSCVVIAGDAPYTRVQSPVSATIAARARCGAKQPDALQQTLIEAQLAAFEQRILGALRDADEDVVVPVHFHVITNASGGGNVSALLAAQMDVLNAAFARAGFAFVLASQEVVRNDSWYPCGCGLAGRNRDEGEASRRRHRGAQHLHHQRRYLSRLGDVPARRQALPRIRRSRPGTGPRCPAPASSFPVIPHRNRTESSPTIRAIREPTRSATGSGLYHLFESGCGRNGDRIADTPAEAEPQFFCAQRDSCSGKKYPGLDPITNFMDYVDDACMVEFTSDQDRRMGKQWKAYRR